MHLIKFFIICSGLWVTGCIEQNSTADNNTARPVIPATAINANDSALQIRNGEMFYRGERFSGTVNDRFSSGRIHSSTGYFNGKEEGASSFFFPGGETESLRFYRHGEKDSVHTGWWPNGNKRFEYHFDNGNYNGDFTEWYAKGTIAKLIHYKNGTELDGKAWRETGKLYMNYQMKDGRRYGLVNDQLCYSLKDEQGNYVK